MPNRVIADTLKNDLTSGSAATYVTNYPDLFTTTADVPNWLYKSLKEIMVGTAGSTADFQRRIVAQIGLGQAVQSGDIQIYSKLHESGNLVDKFDADVAGSESARVQILIQVPRGDQDANPTKASDVSQRIKRLLDVQLRQEQQISSDLTIPKGMGIHGDYHFKCYWEDFTEDLNSLQITAAFTVHYVRIFVK